MLAIGHQFTNVYSHQFFRCMVSAICLPRHNHITVVYSITYYTPQGVNVTKCISNGQLHFVDCLTQLLGGSGSDSVTGDLNLESKVDTSTPLKSYSLDPKSVKHVLYCAHVQCQNLK